MVSKISIVTPSLNQGAFIEETIRSVLSQQGEFYLDYIIIDGGSTDNSVAVIRKYASLLDEGKWPVRCSGIKYRWLSEKDKGQSSAINRGFRMAEGEVVAWLNSDDYYTDGALAAAVPAIRREGSLAMIYGDGYLVNIEGNAQGAYLSEPLFDLWKLIHLYDFILQPSVFMNRAALEKAGLLNEDLHFIMDWELWIRLSRFGRIRHIPEKLSCARTHRGTKTGSAGLQRWREIRWCARRYGSMKWPPVAFTQLFHRPLQIAVGGRSETAGFFSFLLPRLRKVYYACIGGNKSGISPDGHAERVAFLSVPLRGDVSKLKVRVLPVCADTIRYFINNASSAAGKLDRKTPDIEITLSDEMRTDDFLHIRFVSDRGGEADPSVATFGGNASFLIQDISLQGEDGRQIRDIGLPEFRGESLARSV
jgi:glycosyltransferase involved in cell wall biosynthesis